MRWHFIEETKAPWRANSTSVIKVTAPYRFRELQPAAGKTALAAVLPSPERATSGFHGRKLPLEGEMQVAAQLLFLSGEPDFPDLESGGSHLFFTRHLSGLIAMTASSPWYLEDAQSWCKCLLSLSCK